MIKNALLAALLATAFLPSTGDCGAWDELSSYFKRSMPGEAFVPTPYGADSRFRPKSIWIYVDEFQAVPGKPKRQPAWIVASSGESIYDNIYAPIQTQPITLPTSGLSALTKYSLAASLSGTLNAAEFDAGVQLAQSKGIDLDINFGETEVQYVYYMDLLTAQDINNAQRARFKDALKRRFGRDIPISRVVTASLRARNATVQVKNTSNIDVTADASLAQFLSKLGFSFDRNRAVVDRVNFNDWRYIAYQSRYTDDDVRVSDAAQAEPVQIVATNTAPFQTNAFGQIQESSP